MPFTIARATAPTSSIRSLIAELDEFLAGGYTPEQRHGISFDAIFKPGIEFFTAAADGEEIGCAGIALYEDFGEVKRMYVRPAWRGRGAAQALMSQLESSARAAGLKLLRLETGINQPAALKFYQREGFAACPAFEPYASMPASSIVTSLFFEKQLDGAKS
jgi:putative acetyltransferase